MSFEETQHINHKQLRRTNMKKQTNAQKCENFDQQILEIKNKLNALRDQWQQMNLFELDKEQNEIWDSVVVEDELMNIQTAINALDGLI